MDKNSKKELERKVETFFNQFIGETEGLETTKEMLKTALLIVIENNRVKIKEDILPVICINYELGGLISAKEKLQTGINKIFDADPENFVEFLGDSNLSPARFFKKCLNKFWLG